MSLSAQYKVYLNGGQVRVVGVGIGLDFTTEQGGLELQPYNGSALASQLVQLSNPNFLVAANNQNFLDEFGTAYSPGGIYSVLQTALQPILDPAPSGGGDATAANQVLEIAQLTQINSNTNPNNKPYLERVAAGEIPNTFLVLKSGYNPDIDTGTVPEDIWSGGGAYTGFPAAAAEMQIVSSSAADVGILTVTYLASPTSTTYTTADFNVTGTTVVNTGTTIFRCHQATYRSTANPTTTFNAGVITVRFRLTPAVVFVTVQPGRNLSNEAVYTVPATKKALIKRVDWHTYAPAGLLSAPFSNIRGALYVRKLSDSPKLISDGLASYPSQMQESLIGGILVEGLADIAARVSASQANNAEVVCNFDLLVY